MSTKSVLVEIKQLLGIPRNSSSHSEKLLSALGAGISILVISILGVMLKLCGLLDHQGAYMVVASMGASAVLLFAVPHGALSQPWALIGGHLISAFIGVTSFYFLGNTFLGSAFAVGLAVGAMYYCRCIHPPGGATALTAVIGGASVNDLGFTYLIMPVLMNVSLILIVAIAFNFGFQWRRYPAHLYHKRIHSKGEPAPSTRVFELTQEDLSAAIQELDSFVDITEEGLTDLLELAKQHAEKNVVHPREVIAGRFYSNGKLGKLWSIRQVVDASEEGIVLPSKDKVIYKVVAGDQGYITGICLREEFKKWARFEVVQSDNRWVKSV